MESLLFRTFAERGDKWLILLFNRSKVFEYERKKENWDQRRFLFLFFFLALRSPRRSANIEIMSVSSNCAQFSPGIVFYSTLLERRSKKISRLSEGCHEGLNCSWAKVRAEFKCHRENKAGGVTVNSTTPSLARASSISILRFYYF